MPERSIGIVIPVHNRRELTQRLLLQLELLLDRDYETIVVDDGSVDGTGEMIRADFPDVTLLCGDGNYWWTKSTNVGIRHALSDGVEWILTLNDDLAVSLEYFSNLKKIINSSDGRSIFGSVAVSSKDCDTIVDGGCWINKRTGKRREINAGQRLSMLSSRSQLVKVNVLPGRGTLIPAMAFQEIGYFEEQLLPHYASDYEFSHRALKSGYLLYVHYDLVIISNEEETGLNIKHRNLTVGQAAMSFFSVRSSNCIKYRWRFSYLMFGRIEGFPFFLLDMSRTVISVFRKLLRDRYLTIPRQKELQDANEFHS